MMKKQTDPVIFTEETLREITALYDAAVAAGKDLFTYKGREYSTRYTYYLIQMMHQKWGMKKQH